MCEHQFVYAGVRYCDSEQSMPGTGARQRYYAHIYYCSKCTDTKGEPIKDSYPSGRPQWNSYQKLEFGATPGTPDQCGVPLHDRHR